MERERPPYLGNLPRDRRGNWPLYLLAALLLAALVGGWKVYTSTVAGWHTRFNAPAAERHSPVRDAAPAISAEEQAAMDAEREEFQRQARERHARERATWRCIDGTPFRPMPGGGWENVRGARC